MGGSPSHGATMEVIVRFRLASSLLLTLLLVTSAGAQSGHQVDFGGDGVFSYTPPSGWRVTEFPGIKYKIALGAVSKGFTPNIVVVDEFWPGSLDDYVKNNIATMKASFQDLKILDQTDFATSDGVRAIKLITERYDDQPKKELRQIFYFFDSGDKKIVATCSSLAEDGASLDQSIDAAMKTFRVAKTEK